MPDITRYPLANTNTPRKTARSPARFLPATRHLPAIRVLPNEILLVTFFQAVRIWDKRCAPWVIASVCKYWRKIALSCSRLWMKVQFRLGVEWHLEEVEIEYAFMLLQLDRALPRDIHDHIPIDLEVDLPVGPPSTDAAPAIRDFMRRCFTEILTRVRVLRFCKLSAPPEGFLTVFVCFQAPKARYSHPLGRGEHPLLDSRLWEGTSHALRSLSLTDISFLHHPDFTGTPTLLPQLTSLKISYPNGNGSPEFLIRLLASTPRLEELSVILGYDDVYPIEHTRFWPEMVGLPPVQLRGLKNFSFDTSPSGCVTATGFFCVLIKFCTAPSLQTFHFQNMWIAATEEYDFLRAHLQSPGHIACANSLISLSLIDCQFYESHGEGIPQSLDWFTSLEELVILSGDNFTVTHYESENRYPDRIDLLRALSSDKGASLFVDGLDNRVLCPRLRRLTLTNCLMDPTLIGTLVYMRSLGEAMDSPKLAGSALEVLTLINPTLISNHGPLDGRDFLEEQTSKSLLRLELLGEVHTTTQGEWDDPDSEVDELDF